MLQVSFSSCQASLDDQAEKEARDFTRKSCPMVMGVNQRIDSLTFDRQTHTLSYHYTLMGELDNPQIIEVNKDNFNELLYKNYKNSLDLKKYREKDYTIKYIYYSETNPQLILHQVAFKGEDMSASH